MRTKYLRRGKTVDRALGMRVEQLELLMAFCAILGGLCYLMSLVLMAL